MVGGLVGLAKNNIYLSGGISNLTPYRKKIVDFQNMIA